MFPTSLAKKVLVLRHFWDPPLPNTKLNIVDQTTLGNSASKVYYFLNIFLYKNKKLKS